MKPLRFRIALLLAFFLAAAGFSQDERSLPVDFVFLVDRSLSMKPVLEDVKRYLASDVIGPLVLPGDSVTLLAFYGKVEKIWEGRVSGEADKAALIRSLHRLAPDGRYTDIGRALDFLDPVVQDLNAPERVKYILLLTDERQEAPPDSPYGSRDYTVSHPYLTYINRRDFGTFRAITIGLGLDERISSTAESLASFLKNPPERSDQPLPGSRESDDSSPESGSAINGSSRGIAENETAAASRAGGTSLPLVLGTAAGLGILAAIILIARARSGKGKDKEREKEETRA